jgi:hypothetical protein
MKITVFWDVAPCSVVEGQIALLEVASTSETLVNFYQTTRRNIPEYIHLHTRRRENLTSHHDRHMSSSFYTMFEDASLFQKYR